MRHFSCKLLLALLALVIPGCGSSQGIWVQGKVTKGGARYEAPPDQKLNLTFYLVDPSTDGARTSQNGQGYMAVFKPEDGTFSVSGPDRQGIPPGKYRVSLTQKLTREAVDKKNSGLKPKQAVFDRDTDMLKGLFGEDSPIVREIKDSTEVVIDLDTEMPAAKQAAEEREREQKKRAQNSD